MSVSIGSYVSSQSSPTIQLSETSNSSSSTSGTSADIASGSFNLKTPGSAGAGAISPDRLETSTVDLPSQFADLITTQQAYSASAKVITTAETMEQALLQTIQ